ncbi:unnamed protein product [Effrenium voratum]|uniref:Jacalin-type lectin domain-containing protein n=1 Tax=Effrenium voratum TaxID=2562239 RepID=A0AA36J8U2_9DINO|nr:unnamed protein product [Effrenium voratum]CAJ1433085.1 unnamed protein product [Effrenium voratum]
MFGSTAIGFARNALILSFRDGHKYYIAVTRRKRHDRPIPVHPGFPFRARKLVHEAEQAIQSLLARMAKGNASVEKAEAAIAKAVRKAMAEFGPKEVAEDIPLVGFFTGLFFSALRLWDGDYRKASEEFVAGLAGEFPGPGWAISTAINVDLLAADVKEFVATEQSRAQAGRAEAEAAEKAIELEWLQLAELNYGSPIFGAAQGSVNMLFDDLAFAHKGKLSAVFIRSGEAINGIQAFYGSAAPHAVAAPYHGRGQLLGGQPHLFVLREGEHLVGIEVWHGGHIDAMVLYTSSGRHSQEFGGRGGHRDFYRAPEGMRISSFRGYVDEVVLRLGVSISPLEEHPVLAHVPRGVSLTLPQERCVYRIEPHGGTDRGRTMLSCTSGGVVDLFGFDDQSGRQQWTFVHVSDDFYNILVASGTHSHALMLSTTPDGKTVDLFGHDDGSGRQRWRLTPLQSSNGTLYRIEVSGGVKNDRLLSCTPDGKVDLFGRDDDSGRQKWKLVLLGWPKL